jgi:hypothetical protein
LADQSFGTWGEKGVDVRPDTHYQVDLTGTPDQVYLSGLPDSEYEPFQERTLSV